MGTNKKAEKMGTTVHYTEYWTERAADILELTHGDREKAEQMILELMTKYEQLSTLLWLELRPGVVKQMVADAASKGEVK